MTWRIWLRGLVAAFIGSFSSAAVGALTLPTVFNLSHDGLFNFAKICLIPGLYSAFTYLKQSPVPATTTTVQETKTIAVTETKE